MLGVRVQPHQVYPPCQSRLSFLEDFSNRLFGQVRIQWLGVQGVLGEALVEKIPIVYIVKVDVMDFEHRLLLVLLNRDFLLSLPEQLILDQFIYVDIVVAILTVVLHGLVLGIQQLVLSTANTVHELLVLHELINALQDHVHVLDVHG